MFSMKAESSRVACEESMEACSMLLELLFTNLLMFLGSSSRRALAIEPGSSFFTCRFAPAASPARALALPTQFELRISHLRCARHVVRGRRRHEPSRGRRLKGRAREQAAVGGHARQAETGMYESEVLTVVWRTVKNAEI